MRKRKIGDDLFVIYLNGNYYVVNQVTFELISFWMENPSVKDLAKKLKLSKKETLEIYTVLRQTINHAEYYDDNIDLDFPLKVQWRIVNQCNLKCKHCYLGDFDNFSLSNEMILKIANNIISNSVLEVTLTGGEALLVHILPEIVEMFTKNDIKVNVFTNGLLLDSFLSVLESKNIDKRMLNLFVSIDGLKETHERMRGVNTFDKVIKNLSYAHKLGYFITTNSVLTKLNYWEIPELYTYLRNLGVDKIQISNVVETGRGQNMRLTAKQHEQFFNELTTSVVKNGKADSLLYADLPDEECKSNVYLIDKEKKHFLQLENWKCSAGVGKATIDANGDVYCCPFIKSSKIGNVLNENLRDIWTRSSRFSFLEKLGKDNNNSRVCLALKNKSLM